MSIQTERRWLRALDALVKLAKIQNPGAGWGSVRPIEIEDAERAADEMRRKLYPVAKRRAAERRETSDG